MVVFDPGKGPYILIGIVVNAMHKIEDDVGVIRFWKGVLMKPDTRRRRHFGNDARVLKQDLILPRLGDLVGMRKTGAKTALRIAFFTRCQLQGADGRHDQEIAQIRVPGAAKMRV